MNELDCNGKYILSETDKFINICCNFPGCKFRYVWTLPNEGVSNEPTIEFHRAIVRYHTHDGTRLDGLSNTNRYKKNNSNRDLEIES